MRHKPAARASQRSARLPITGVVTTEVAGDTRFVEEATAAGMAAVELLFDGAMARFASLYQDWQHCLRETLEPQCAHGSGADRSHAQVA